MQNDHYSNSDLDDSSGILGLDLGTKRVGVAVSHGFMAEPLPHIEFNEKNVDKFIDKINSLVKEQKIGKVIIGLPLGRDGKETEQSIWTSKLVEMIRNKINADIILVEESYSSVSAESMVEKRNNEKGLIDSLSAKIILEQYLNENRS